jgi:hypothetical protein
MTRPGLVRADTVDLQDTENPTASNHQKHPQPNGIAPHQAAQVQHAMEERHSEEQSLDNVWRDQGEEDAGANGEQEKTNGEEDHGEAGESEGESEDDMMDRISSSPSIDDGGFSFHSSPPITVWPSLSPRSWPARYSSLSAGTSSALTPTRETFNQSACNLSSSSSSSPFVESPRNLPLHPLRSVRGSVSYARSPTRSESFSGEQRMAWSPPLGDDEFLFSCEYHQMGKYETDRGRSLGLDDEEPRRLCSSLDMHINGGESYQSNFAESAASKCEWHSAFQDALDQIDSPPGEPPSASFPSWIDRKTEHLSVSDRYTNSPRPAQIDTPNSNPFDKHLSDSAGDHVEQSDDNNAFLDLNDRLIDSGWGGECLRDIEDIDFEFVYALHTFVATVEGQANATKGDTMVLLDDSNSYWWLVRVVKDSSIGEDLLNLYFVLSLANAVKDTCLLNISRLLQSDSPASTSTEIST